MATNRLTENESVSVGELVQGIVKDLEALGTQHIRLLKKDLKEDFQKLREATLWLAVGLGVLLVGGALLGLTLSAGCDQTGYETTDETDTTTTPSYDTDMQDTTTPPPTDTELEDIEDRQATVPPPTDPGAQEASLVGVLEQSQGDQAQVGQWMLTGTEHGDIPVDVTNVTEDVNSLEGSRVLVTGELIERSDAQGGPTQVLIADRIEAA
jgi:hypothetical protein